MEKGETPFPERPALLCPRAPEVCHGPLGGSAAENRPAVGVHGIHAFLIGGFFFFFFAPDHTYTPVEPKGLQFKRSLYLAKERQPASGPQSPGTCSYGAWTAARRTGRGVLEAPRRGH